MPLATFDNLNIHRLYTELKTRWERKKPEWEEIARFVGIRLDTDYVNNRGSSQDNARDLDDLVNDPTAALSVNQAGDFMLGVMWGTGEGVLDLIPSRYVTELTDKALVEDFYAYATDQLLYHMNHQDAGLSTSMKPYSYDQFGFGTSGIGGFHNPAFLERIDENALIFRSYGVDNTMIDEGKSGLPDTVFCVYNWKINRIVGEFAKTDGAVDEKKLRLLPDPIQQAYIADDFNQVFQIVFGVFPRGDFDPKLRGKRGARYRGVWFMDDESHGTPFFEEDFADRPIAIARAIKVRGETYGRASGTLLINTIRSVNFMVGVAISIVDKMSRPPLGIMGDALFGDSVLDTSPQSLTVFNQAMAGSSGTPIFPIHDVGDPAAILNFLVPWLNDKIVTAFKVDALLDFSSGSTREQTATESLQRSAIRGKSLAGMLLQQKNELLVPLTKRCISLLLEMGELGIDPEKEEEKAQALIAAGRQSRVIPNAVLEVIRSGRPWYELKFNNELEQLLRTENVQALLQMIQTVGAIAGLFPQIIEAVDWHKLLKDVNDNLAHNSQLLLSADEFKDQVAAAAQAQQEALAAQAALAGGQLQKDAAQANKDNRAAERE